MYFQTSNHALDIHGERDKIDNKTAIENIANNISNDCLICLEIKDCYRDNYCIKLCNNYFIKRCACNGWIHYYCLNIWYSKNKNCPICLIKMIKKRQNNKNKYHNKKYNENFNNATFSFYIKNTLRFIILFCIFYNIISILITVQNLVTE
jgi:hypothetical protein